MNLKSEILNLIFLLGELKFYLLTSILNEIGKNMK